MNRREFLAKTAAASLVLSPALAALFSSCRPAGAPGEETLRAGELAEVSIVLQQKINTLFGRLEQTGWLDHIKTLGLELPVDADLQSLVSSIDQETLQKLRATGGFEDFGGNKFIEPGYPAFSLLYHLLANPRLRPAGFKAHQYAEPEQIDLLEDYIYALLPWEEYKKEKHYGIASDEELVLAVFAYEYRTAFKTPHHRYADMVFSRTGIGRVGSQPYLYDRENRCYPNNPSGDPKDEGIAVTPAKYALFIAKKVPYTHKDLSAMEMEKEKNGDTHYRKHDTNSEILLPVRKLFNDDLLTGSAAIGFDEYHENSKIAKLLLEPSLIRTSADLTQHAMLNSAFLLYSRPANLIRPLLDAKRHVRTFNAAVYNQNNRYFTAYFNDSIVREVEDIEILDSSGRVPNSYNWPRNSPMYVHLAHRLVNDTSVAYEDRLNTKDFEEQVINGERKVPLFEDSLCDGFVSCSISVKPGSPLKAIAGKGVLNAFSIITAPDFFPQVDDFDFQEFDIAPGSAGSSLFYEGGIASLATCDVPPNPFVYKADAKPLVPLNPKNTYTAVISKKGAHDKANPMDSSADFKSPAKDKGYFFSSYLPDMCSSVFAPGWDVTYSGEKGNIFLSTQGLGSPFVEDMKLCAAMNGMWPAASPDASRTFQGSVTIDQYENDEWERNPTAVPLMDDEIGFSAASPAVKEHGLMMSCGWDGEQGPFIESLKEKGGDRWYINFTDLGRADYVENTLMNTLDMSKLRALDSREVHFRMTCLRACLQALDSRYSPNGFDSIWLVSAEKAQWNAAVQGYGIPGNLLPAAKGWATTPRKGISGEGFLFVFVKYKPDANRGAIRWVEEQGRTKRRRVVCEEIYVCQVTPHQTAYYKIDTKKNNSYTNANWKFANT